MTNKRRKPIALSRVGDKAPDITAISISGNGQRAVTGSYGNGACVWDFRSGNILHRLINQTDSVWGCGISDDGTRVVTSSLDGKVHFSDATSGKCVFTCQALDSALDTAYDCWMSADGLHVIAVYGNIDLQKAELVVYRWSLANNVVRSSQHIFSKAIRRLSASPGLEILAFTTVDGKDHSRTLHFVHLHTFKKLRSSFQLSRGSRGLGPGICVASNAPAVVVADTESLRVLHPHDARKDIDLPLPNPPIGYAPCAINAIGTRVLASTLDNSFSIWDVSKRKPVTSMKECTETGLSCAMSSDEKTIVIGRLGGNVKRHHIPTPKLQRSFEKLLNASTGSASIISEKFLIDNIKAEHIQTAFDLFIGHNIVLLAMRHGVLTKKNIAHFGGVAWGLERQLYGAVRNLDSSQDSKLIDAVLLHAEELGIIRNGVLHAAIRDAKIEIRTEFRRIDHHLRLLSQQILHVDERMQVVESNVTILAEHLSSIHGYLRRGAKIDKYSAIAKAILACIPILGPYAGHVVDGIQIALSGVEILMCTGLRNFVKGVDDVPGDLNDVAFEKPKQRFETDLTNPRSLKNLISEESFSRMQKDSKEGISMAIGKSSFRTIKALRQGLVALEAEKSSGGQPHRGGTRNL